MQLVQRFAAGAEVCRCMPRMPTEGGGQDPLAGGANHQRRRVAPVVWGVWAALFVVSLGLASRYDLDVSEDVAFRESGWGKFFEAYGEVPGYLVGLAGALVLLATTNYRKPADPTAWEPRSAAFGIVLLMMVLFTVGAVINQALLKRDPDKVVSGLIATALVGVPGPALAIHLGPARRDRLAARLRPWRFLARSIVSLAIIGLLVLYCAKTLWGRARPRMVLPAACATPGACGDATWPAHPDHHCDDSPAASQPLATTFPCAFTGWWQPQFGAWWPARGYHGLTSFPSGHTFSGWVPLPLALHWCADRTRAKPRPI